MEFAFLGTYSPTGWDDWLGSSYRVDDRGAVALAKKRFPTYVSPELALAGLAAVDLDVDLCGVLYVLSADGSLHRYDRQQGTVERIPCLGRGNARSGEATTLCVTRDTIYVGYANDERSQAAVEPGGGSDTERDRDWVETSRHGTERPVPASPGGSVRAFSAHVLQTRWITDEASFGEQRRPLGRPLAIVEGEEAVYTLEREVGGSGGYVSALAATGGAITVIDGLATPMDAEIDDEGNLYVLTNEDDDPVIWRFSAADLRGVDEPITPRNKQRWIAPVEPDRPVCIETAEEGELLIGVSSETDDEQVLYRYRRAVDASNGDVPFVLDRVPALKRSCRQLCLSRGRTYGSIRGLYAIDADRNDVYFLDEEYYNRRNERTGRYDARIVTRYDAGDPRIEWHRARVGLELKDSNTRVQLTYCATDESEPLDDVTGIAGIGPVYADRLREAGIDGISELIRLESDAIASITDAPMTEVRKWFTRAWARFDAWFASNGKRRGFARSDPRDVLFENATGRYLWVALDLIGTESTSPRVDSFRAYFPRQSYLRYLPTIYQEDVEGASFLERFLSVFESEFVDLEEEIEGIGRFLDARGVPSPYFSWLARWLAVETDETWSDAARRELLSQAPELYRRRGTREGLLGIVGIYLGHEESTDGSGIELSATDGGSPVDFDGGGPIGAGPGLAQAVTIDDTVEPTADDVLGRPDDGSERSDDGMDEQVGMYLLEYSDLNCIDDDDIRKDYRRLLSCPHCFLVLIGPSVDRQRLRAIQRIVDAERPAHTIGRVVGLRSSLRLGEHSYLGINTTLSDRAFLLEHSGLGNDSVLREREPYGQIGLRSRVGEDDVLS